VKVRIAAEPEAAAGQLAEPRDRAGGRHPVDKAERVLRMGWFRRRSAPSGPAPNESGRVVELLLIVAQNALRWRSPDWFGQGAYYVRAYRPESGDLPVIIIADTGNDPAASSTNRFAEIAVLAAEAITGIPRISLEDLGKIATWVDCIPAHGPFGETYYEMTLGSTDSAKYSPTSRYLRHADVEELVKGQVESLTFEDCAAAPLRKRGVQVWTVG
jgi:hypothetical protein